MIGVAERPRARAPQVRGKPRALVVRAPGTNRPSPWANPNFFTPSINGKGSTATANAP